ncbi:unnamed protein product, partial [Rhizoctonia solani]
LGKRKKLEDQYLGYIECKVRSVCKSSCMSCLSFQDQKFNGCGNSTEDSPKHEYQPGKGCSDVRSYSSTYQIQPTNSGPRLQSTRIYSLLHPSLLPFVGRSIGVDPFPYTRAQRAL